MDKIVSNKVISDKQHMHKMRWIRLCGIVLAIILFAVFLIRVNLQTPVLYAVDGHANAMGNALEQAVYMIGGELVQYNGTHTPEELAALLPIKMKDVRYVRQMGGNTHVFTLNANENLSFFMARTAESRVWVNGLEVGAEKGGKIRPNTCYRLGDFGNTGVYTFVIATPFSANNLRGYRGILVGGESLLARLQNYVAIADIISIGLYIMMIVLCLALYVQKRSETHLMILAVASIITMLRWLPTVRFSEFAQLNLYMFAASVKLAMFLRYFIFYPFITKQLWKKLFPVVLALILLWFVSVLLDIPVLQDVSLYCYLIIEGVILASGILSGYPGCSILLCGWSVMISFEFFYLLLNTGVIPQGLVDVYIQPMPYGSLLYLVCCTVASFGVFAGKYKMADDLSANLESKVVEQTAELRAANELLKRSQMDKQRFMTDIAHNLRNPLFALGGYLDLLIKATPEPTNTQKKNLDKASAKLQDINNMVDSILFISRLQDNKVEFHFMEFPIHEMLESALSDTLLKADAKGITIKLDYADAPETLVGDRFWLQQALDNILDNAVRYSYNDSFIECYANTLPGDLVRISITDHGNGITPEQLPRLFARYDAKGKGGSLGLGLSISREIIQQHNGNLTVISAEGQGATVRIELPVHQ